MLVSKVPDQQFAMRIEGLEPLCLSFFYLRSLKLVWVIVRDQLADALFDCLECSAAFDADLSICPGEAAGVVGPGLRAGLRLKTRIVLVVCLCGHNLRMTTVKGSIVPTMLPLEKLVGLDTLNRGRWLIR